MPTILKSDPVAMPVVGLAVEFWGASTAVPIGISRDRTRIYGSGKGDNSAASNTLYESTTDGASWTSVRTFTDGVVSVLELDDGEALVYTVRADNGESYIYRSTGWGTSRSGATMTKVLTAPGGRFSHAWSGHFSSFGDDKVRAATSRVGVACEYGGQTTGSGDQTGKGRRLWVTQNYGATWTLAFDLTTRWPGVANLHMHACAYDPWADRMWATYGDAPQDDSATQALLYSDDRGATWNAFPLPPEFVGLNYLQCTSVVALDDCILLGSDNQTGQQLWRIPRQGYRKFGPAQAVVPGETGLIGQSIHRNRGVVGAPILVGYTSPNGKASGIIASHDGRNFAEVWRDVSTTKIPGPTTVFGPTANGKIVACMIMPADSHLLRGELVVPDGGQHDGAKVFAGNGSTTIFTVAHGLSAAPTRYQGWSTNAVGGPFTVTADATNLIFTYATAPGNGTAPSVAYRWAP